MLVFCEQVPRHIWRVAIVRRVLPNKDYETRRAIVKIVKNNSILKCPANKLFVVENTYHDTNKTDKAREQKYIPCKYTLQILNF